VVNNILTTVTHSRVGPMDVKELTLTLTVRHEQRCSFSHDRMAGRETPLCADVPHHRGFTGVYPRDIQSFSPFLPEKRSNNAQSSPLTVTPLGTGRPLCASRLLLISNLSPEPRRPARSVTGRTTDVQHRAGWRWYTQG